jgi:GDP-4-dehydro-6-deoxy-D-mannose reductase
VRVLITGASGFAGQWLARACAQAGDEVTGVSRSGATPSGRGVALDLRDTDAVATLVASVEPEVVYHLAALSHVGRSWSDPGATLDANVSGAASLLEAIRLHAPEARVVWASSCEVYGTVAQLPVTEQAPLHPVNPYAVSKAAGEMLAAVYADAHGLSIVRARPFNHVGPGQLPIFIVSSLARQAAAARRAGDTTLEITTGNPETRRDYTDVRDVVAAYRLLAAVDIAPGAYNIATGSSVSSGELVSLVASLVPEIEVRHAVDPAQVRAHEVMDHRGSHAALSAATGWQPTIPLRQTMVDTLAWWEQDLAEIPN